MRSRIIVSLAALVALVVSGPCVAAQKPLLIVKPPRHLPMASVNFPDDSISIVTEGLSAMSGRDDDRIAELARVYAFAGLPRLLPVAGLGPIANARDLLHMRGIDLAVIDADIRAYARIDGHLTGAETHLTQLLKLYDKTVYIIGAADVTALSDLAHQRVLAIGDDSDGHVTARTVFGLANIDIELGSADLQASAAALAGGTAKALVLVAGPGENPLQALPKDKGLHVLPVPESEAIDKIYGRTTVAEQMATGLVPIGGVTTVKVATLLATYAWRPNIYRYGPVLQFVRALPQAIQVLRTGDSGRFWQAVDAQAQLPDWQIFEAAAPILATIAPATYPPDQPAQSATPTIGAQTSGPATPPPRPPAAKPINGGIELVAMPLPGLASAGAPGGGLFPEIVTASLSNEHTRLSWAKDAAGAAQSIEAGPGARLGLAWQRPDCTGTEPLTEPDKASCERFVFSKPVFQALDVFFVRHGSDFTFDRDEQVAGRSVCAAADADVSAMDAPGHRWLKQEMLTLLHRATLTDCLAALDHGDVDAVFGDEMAGQASMEQAGQTGRLEVVDRPVGVRNLSVVAVKSAPDAVDLIARVEAGLAALKSSGRYSSLVMSRMHREQFTKGEQVLQ